MDYTQSLDFLSNLLGKKNTAKNALNLKRISCLLELMDNPQNDYQCIHVVGTSGKGSVSTICQKIFSSSNFKTGLHISPHIQVPNERMQVEDKFASKTEFAQLAVEISQLASKVEKRVGLGNPTYFEATFAMALRHFQNKKVDYAVIETGLGGRLDATNVIKPAALILTNVSLDHTRTLGPTISAITNEKIGAIKQNSKVITACINKPLSLVKIKCLQTKSKLYQFNSDFKIIGGQFSNKFGSEFTYQPINEDKQEIKLNLLGPIQPVNFSLASAAVELVLDDFNAQNLTKAASDIFIPCRFELVQKNNPQVILDGSHNVAKITEFLRTLSLFDEEKTGIFAISKGKNAKKISRMLESKFKKLYVSEVKTTRKFFKSQTLHKYLPNSIQTENPIEALNNSLLDNNSMVVATGSFYLAGLLRQNWLSNEDALRHQSLKLH